MKKSDAVISIVVLLSAFGYLLYRQFWYEAPKEAISNVELFREISTVVTYAAPGKEDTVRFTVTVDSQNVIQKVTSVDVNDPSHQVNLDKFSANLTGMIKGKRLDELEKVDRVGTSSLTTDAFNSGLEALKAQI